jgi:pimeloyl-ACP methyl ester carboxylesterase
LEYFIFGETDQYDKILVEFNGFGGTGKALELYFNQIYKSFKIKAISITVPGFGHSSLKEDRKLNEWHLDVEKVLKKEKIEKFWVKGSSFGVSHALEVAYFLKEKIQGVIVSAPAIPVDILKKLNPGIPASQPISFLVLLGIQYFI